MSKKMDLSSTMDNFISDNYGDGASSLDYWTNLSQDDVKELNGEQAKASKERQEKIESLYPVFSREQILLEKLVPADEGWNFFPAQNNGVLEELMKNIVVYGQLTPAIVWKQPNGTYTILGGHTRFQAIQKLHEIFLEVGDQEQAKRFEVMDCNVYDYSELDEIEARKIIIFDNVIRRENSTAVKARSVITMAQLEKDTRSSRRPDTRRTRALDNVALALGEPIGTIKDLYRLRNLISEFWPLVDAGDRNNRITNQLARAIAVLEPELQQYIYENELYKNRLTSSQLAKLKKARSIADLDELFTAPEVFTVTAKAELTEQLPADYKPVLMFCSEDELEKIRDIIEWNVCADNSISKQTKDILRRLFAEAKKKEMV
ncbi:ParB-like nuclease domain-containing protein [Selenomonas ruminantium]|uniref:ParB-like nuclease domain-containing protein n=1 Tax=Selenomonas ruminantium TaxID=971 RepID=A0A1M6X963_SELRU|nr:ParB/Srx family N-terminal domain-containing protein [Selenomonas ruminantium]SHL02520.1 ParB-like nuclease domain-containing protein [Selenomonas ruminantium]